MKIDRLISNLDFFVSFYGFVEGCFEAKELIFYFIYVKILKESLQTYAIIKAIILLPVFFSTFMGMISDNFPILGSRRKKYILILSFFEIFVYLMLFFFVMNKYSTKWVVLGNLLGKTSNTWRAAIICKLTRRAHSPAEGSARVEEQEDQHEQFHQVLQQLLLLPLLRQTDRLWVDILPLRLHPLPK